METQAAGDRQRRTGIEHHNSFSVKLLPLYDPNTPHIHLVVRPAATRTSRRSVVFSVDPQQAETIPSSPMKPLKAPPALEAHGISRAIIDSVICALEESRQPHSRARSCSRGKGVRKVPRKAMALLVRRVTRRQRKFGVYISRKASRNIRSLNLPSGRVCTGVPLGLMCAWRGN